MSKNATPNEKETIRTEFDAVAPAYESNRLSPWYKAHAQEILAEMANIEHGDVLDIGCATGYFLRHYLAGNPDARGLGLDIAPNMIAVAHQYAQDKQLNKLDYISHDWETMDKDEIRLPNLHTIVCANTFHYFSDPQAATDKMAALLNKGDRLYILERDKSRSLLTLFWGIMHRTIIKDHVVFYDQNALKEILDNAGFTDIKIARHLKRYFWKGKLFTNVILISCKKA